MTEQRGNSPRVGSPEWWVARLTARMDERIGSGPLSRNGRMRIYDQYYRGTQRLAFMSDQFVATFGRNAVERFGSNFMALVVDAHRQRLQIQGFRFGDDPDADDTAWRIWQANNLDAESMIAHTESLVKGVAYSLTWLEAGQQYPTITVEDPLEAIVETSPGNRRKRRAAMKRWLGDDGRLHCTLYLPDAVYKYQSAQRDDEFSVPYGWYTKVKWEPRRVEGEDWPLANPIGVVPMVPILNRPRITGEGESEIATLMSLQDVMNKELADMLTASEFVAFPQRWITGYDPPIDPATGEPMAIEAAANRLWILNQDPEDPNAPNIALGQFAAADLGPYTKVMDTLVQHIGSQSQTPYHYLLPQAGQPPSGESLKSAETGLEAKVADSRIHKGEGWEETIRVAFAWLNDARATATSAEVIWRPSESRSESEHTDAIMKQKALNVPDEILWEQLGYSPQQIARMKRLQIQAQLETALTAPVVSTPVPLQIAAGEQQP